MLRQYQMKARQIGDNIVLEGVYAQIYLSECLAYSDPTKRVYG